MSGDHDNAVPASRGPGPTGNIAIEIRNLSKTFKSVKALDHITLSIYRNEVFGLLGPNGSGKTTLLRILSTLMLPDVGDRAGDSNCSIEGNDILRQQMPIRKITGYVPQQAALYPDLSALDNITLFSTPYDIGKRVQQERIGELLKLVELYDRRHQMVRTFSGGMIKRLSIICALVHRPAVLFLDEITVGLDTSLRNEIWKMVRQLKQESTIVITTHYIPEAEGSCDRVALLSQGHILECGKPADLISKYQPAANLEEVMLSCEKKQVRVGREGHLPV